MSEKFSVYLKIITQTCVSFIGLIALFSLSDLKTIHIYIVFNSNNIYIYIYSFQFGQ